MRPRSEAELDPFRLEFAPSNLSEVAEVIKHRAFHAIQHAFWKKIEVACDDNLLSIWLGLGAVLDATTVCRSTLD